MTTTGPREPASGVPEVLFVCVHNAGRSQMAAALLDHRGQGAVHVRSAGSDPSDRLNPAVVEAMRELGLDISKELPKPLTESMVKAADVVIAMGCGDTCPLYPDKRYLDWGVDDPAGKTLPAVRRIRDEIDQRVQALLAELVGAPAEVRFADDRLREGCLGGDGAVGIRAAAGPFDLHRTSEGSPTGTV